MMEQPLVLLVSLALVSFCGGENWKAPDFCHEEKCPEYKVITKSQDYEERSYVATDWLTTKIEGTTPNDLIAANSRLKDYCKTQKAADYNALVNTWPVVIKITEDHEYFLSWFLPPETPKPELADPSVRLESRPAATVYVRVFGGTPSIETGQENADILWNAIKKDCADLPPYSGAAYESYFSLTHHNEVWIFADDVHCKKTK